MFGMRVRRSGSQRSLWHRRERKRLPAHLRPNPPAPPPAPLPRVPTEAQWLGGDPRSMVRCVTRLATDSRVIFHMTAPEVARKLRLFFCACARHRWDLLPDDVRELVAVLERHAEGEGNGRTLRAARAAALAAHLAARPAWTPEGYAADVWERSGAVGLVVDAAEMSAQLRRWGGGYVGTLPAAVDLPGLLREMFNNPFHPTMLEAGWFTSDVLRLARYIRTERAYELMPVLGDALQDAGCDSAGVLEHCYEKCRRVPGCWLIDALTG